ncbi:DNA-binding transcriptional regulator, MarR family [Asaccharospora irregularis DSM 2635]|uniref:DNA-binding transcriptional regulator, MarR family n=2 Tax=Asaccharospora TaxID=1505660 RepID=A0A1M5NNW3_9FIRM|nr:DNA-binding transcriptional regulator, MarR family [Asaccharospora irregularis DSM 2635]
MKKYCYWSVFNVNYSVSYQLVKSNIWGDIMECIVNDTINFLSKTFPKIYSSLYLNYLKKYSANYDVNKTQLRALMFIKNNGSISMTDLCSKLNIEKGSLTSMVDDLTEKGYVVRERDLGDRRKYLINITESGVKIASDFIEKLNVELEEKLFSLDEEDQGKYTQAINTLQYILSKEQFN